MEHLESTREDYLKKTQVCCFCNTNEIDELNLGPFKWRNDVAVHYYCLLLATDTKQLGRDHEGIAGFLLPDIRKEVRNCRFNVCVYCDQKGASIFCRSACVIVFHLPCGLRNGTLSQFFDGFPSFCHKHRPYQKIALDLPLLKGPWKCFICYESISPTDLRNTLWGPCCTKAGYHRSCIQKLAINSGYLFRCPLCNNKEQFRTEMKTHGIYIPMQDAAWELEENAYQDQQVRYSKCDALDCLCRFGRNHKRRGTRWDIVLCKDCGSQGVHLSCGFLPDTRSSWECSTCRNAIRMTRETKVQPLYKYGSRYISKSKDVAMVQEMSAVRREEIYSRVRLRSRKFTEAGNSGNLKVPQRVTIHPDFYPPRTPRYRNPSRSANWTLDKRICSNHDHYLVVDADRAPQRSNPINYLNVIRNRHLIGDSDCTNRRKVIVKDTRQEEIHYNIRRTYAVKRRNPT